LQYKWSRDYRPERPADNYTFGTAIHYALEQYYKRKADPIQVFRKYARENNTPDPELGSLMMKNYVEHYRNERFKVLYTEQEAARPIPVPDDENPKKARKFYIGAIVDAIVLDLAVNKIFVLEHKTFDSFYPASLPMDQQFVIEKFIAEGLVHKPVSGVIYNGLRKKAEATRSTNLFERHTIYINDPQVKVALYRAYWALKDIHSGHFKIYPEPATMKCNFCEFKVPCTEYMRGGDYQFILDNTFERREDKENDEWL
jgi:hypothetical protein